MQESYVNGAAKDGDFETTNFTKTAQLWSLNVRFDLLGLILPKKKKRLVTRSSMTHKLYTEGLTELFMNELFTCNGNGH